MIKHATIKDLAQALGISKSTVSRALADHSDVKPETKRLVLEMAEKMNYRPNPYAQNLIRRRSKVIGVVVPEFVNSFFPRIIIQIQKVFEKEGFNVLITQSGESAEIELKNLHLLENSMVEGIILSVTEKDRNDEYYRRLIDNGIPIVFFNRPSNEVEASKVVIDEENNRIEAVVPKEQFSIAIGRRGQNVKLASQLLNCDIDVLTEEQEAERRSNENKVRSQRFMEALDVDEMIAHLLIAEGFSTVDEVALVPLHELAEIEGFDEDIATELQDRAKEFIAKRDAEFAEKSKTLGIDDTLKTVTGLDQEMILTLAEKGVKTLDDLADLAADELIEMLGENTLSQTEANKVIMAAREHWFENEGQEGGDERK